VRLMICVLGPLLVALSVAGDEPMVVGVAAPDSMTNRKLWRMLNSPTDKDKDAIFEATAHADANVRRRAINTYAEISGVTSRNRGLTARELDRYRSLLRDPNARVRKVAVGTLRSQVCIDLPILPEMIARLRDDDQDVREETLRMISRSKEPLKIAVPELYRIANGKDLAGLALKTLMQWNEADLVNRLLPDASVELREIAADESMPPFLITLLHDPEIKVRERAIRRLGHLGRSHEKLVRDEILQALEDSNHQILDAAVSVMNSTGLTAYEDTANVEQLLMAVSKTNRDWMGRQKVWSAISIGDRTELRHRLMDLVASSSVDEGMRADALAILTAGKNDHDNSMKLFASSLIQDSKYPLCVRLAALHTIQDDDIASVELPVTFLLEGLAPSVPAAYRKIAATALARKHPEHSRQVLTDRYRAVMKDLAPGNANQASPGRQGSVEWACALLIAATQSGLSANETWNLLRLASTDSHLAIRQTAVQVIGILGKGDKEAPYDREVLHRLLNDEDEWVRYTLIQELQFNDYRRESSRAAIVADDLIAFVFDKSPFSLMSGSAVEILSHCGSATLPAYAPLMSEFALLDEQDAWRDEELKPRWQFVLGALVAISPDNPSVINSVRHVFEREETQADSFGFISSLGPRMLMLLPQLIKIIEESATPDEHALQALGYLGKSAASAVPALEKYLDVEPLKTTTAMSILRINPTHHKAGSVVAEGALSECGLFWCRSSPPCLTFLEEQQQDGVAWFVEALQRQDSKKIPYLTSYILWHASQHDAGWLEPAMRVIANNKDLSDENRAEAQNWLQAHSTPVAPD